MNLFKEFVESEKTGGVLLLFATILSLLLTNVFIGEDFPKLWNISIGHFSIQHIVNDGLMTIFFLLVGLELEREIYVGELSNIRKALLPIIAAIGGMIFPALIHYVFNAGTITQSGAGIPTATDIAFSLAVLSIFSKKVPNSLKIFLTALAIADDLGAVFVIGIFYTKTIFWGNLAIAMSIFFLLLLFNKFKVKSLSLYLLFGLIMWFFMLNSGIHAALVNTSIFIGNDWANNLFSANSLGVFFGLVLGKPIGILFVTFLAITFKVAKFPSDIRWIHIIGASLLAGIGFTMSIFVSGLAFEDATTIQFSQISVLIASTVAALLGMLWFYFFVKEISIKKKR
ncbi:MAG: Na+/H+ antiporter NhaA [Fluviicola sp.]|nr:Na+/H+ antiporter NhaA [Fluviicola sp.]